MEHANAEFEAKYGFCHEECDLCDELDWQEMTSGDSTPAERLGEGIAMYIGALRGEGIIK